MLSPLLKMQSDDPVLRQQAAVSLAWLLYRVADQEVYVGACGCSDAVENEVIIMWHAPTAQCAFCGRTVRLKRLPQYQIEQRGGAWIVIQKRSLPEGRSTLGGDV